MNAVNGDLLELYRAERLREREACIALIRRCDVENKQKVPSFQFNRSELIEQIVERIRSQP